MTSRSSWWWSQAVRGDQGAQAPAPQAPYQPAPQYQPPPAHVGHPPGVGYQPQAVPQPGYPTQPGYPAPQQPGTPAPQQQGGETLSQMLAVSGNVRGPGNRLETNKCPECGGDHFFSRSYAVSESGKAHPLPPDRTPAPRCYDCGFTGLYFQGSEETWAAAAAS